MITSFSDLAEHTGTLVVLIGFVITICGILLAAMYKMVFRIGETLKDDIFKMLTVLDGRITDVWSEISKLRERQVNLRSELPKEYMRLDGPGYRAIIEGLGRIETHFEEFAKDCRDGKCGGKR
jgi:hypothetical protein